MKNTMKLTSLIIAGIFGTSMAAQASVFMDAAGTARLYNTDQAGNGDFVNTAVALNVGTKSNSNGFDLHAGFAFQMINFSDFNDIKGIITADFKATYSGGQGTPIYNVDAYVNRVDSSLTFLNADFENGTKIMDDFLTTSDFGNFGEYSLDATGQQNLLTYLENNWSQNDYIFITLKANTDPGFIMGEDANANYIFTNFGSAPNASTLSIVTTAPEPSTLGLLGIGGAMLMVSRRRKALA